MTSSNIKPDTFVVGTNSTIINYGLTEETVDDTTTYSYYTQKYPTTNQAALDRMKAKLDAKAAKIAADKTLATMVVDADSVTFDADNTSINYMSSVVALASFKMLQALQKPFPDMVDYYDATFKTPVSWKNADNTISNVKLENVAEALEAAMMQVGAIKTNG